MQKKKNNRGDLLGIAPLIYATFFTGVMIKPIGRYLNPILEKFYEVQPLKEGWFIGISVLLYFPAVLLSAVYLKILYDDFNLGEKIFSNSQNSNKSGVETREQIWKLDKKTVECSNSLCKGQIRLTKYKEGFVKCPHCNQRFYIRT
jgi:hypothetical protein